MPQIDPYQMVGASSQTLGVTLRRGWGRRIELAADGLDEFTRKEAYRDWLLFALLELGVKSLRVPLVDLSNADSRKRMEDFLRLGFEFTVYSLGAPDEKTLATLKEHGNLVKNWELIFPEYLASRIDLAVSLAQDIYSGQLFVAPVVPIKEDDGDGKTFQHFASHGFSSKQMEKVEKWLAMFDYRTDHVGLTFRVSPWDDPVSALGEIDKVYKGLKLVNLQLPRLDEGIRFEDDEKLSAFIVDVYKASLSMINTTVFLDTFMESDRGYYPRNGLLDRRFNPRPAFYALKLASLDE